MRRLLSSLAVAASAVTPLAGQVGPVRAAAFYESYSFDAGLIFDRVTEITVPVGLDVGLGRLGTLALSTGFARIALASTDQTQLTDQNLSGTLDTELRLSLNIVPGRLIAVANGTLPTGIRSVEQDQLSILGALSSDVIGFSAPSLGGGGAVGGGLVTALPLGRFALGVGGTYRLPLAYEPVIGRTDDLKPGAEFRLRTGLEGPLSRRTYVRLAVIYAVRQKDQVAGSTQHGVGNRIIAYLSANQQLGSTALTLYGFDVFRGSPQVEGSALGAAILPRGNLMAGGFRWAVPLGRATVFTPRAELRVSSAAPDTTAGVALQRLGSSVRVGFDFRRRLGASLAMVLQGGYASGSVRQGDADVGFGGFRSAFHLELTP